jgi:hypothetical protein
LWVVGEREEREREREREREGEREREREREIARAHPIDPLSAKRPNKITSHDAS